MKKRAYIYIITSGILWGTSGIFFNLLTPFGFSTMQMTAMRGVVSAVFLVVYVLLHNRQLFKVAKKEFALFGLSGIAVFGTSASYYAAIQASSISTAVVLMYTAPVFVMAFSVARLGEKLTGKKVISVICMIIGCVLVSGIIGNAKFSLLGIMLGLTSGIAYSAYNIITKIEMIHKCNSLSATLYCFIFVGAISLIFSKPADMAVLIMQNPVVVLLLMIGIGIGTSVLPYFFYTLALKEIPAGTASALGIIEPMSATVFSVLFFNEKIGTVSACGIALILIAVFMLSRSDS